MNPCDVEKGAQNNKLRLMGNEPYNQIQIHRRNSVISG